MKTMLFIFILFVHALASADEIDFKKWRVSVAGGLLLDAYDQDIGHEWRHQVGESPVLAMDFTRSHFFSRNLIQIQYGIEVEHLKSVSKIAGSKIITEGTLFMLRGGMFLRPRSLKRFAFGHSLSLVMADNLTSRLDTGRINVVLNQGPNNQLIGGSDVSWDLVNRLWFVYNFTSNWEGFARLDTRGVFFNYSQSFGVSYAF